MAAHGSYRRGKADLSEAFEALCLRLCSILGIRSIVEQPVGSRFFRHPDMQAECSNPCWSVLILLMIFGFVRLVLLAAGGCRVSPASPSCCSAGLLGGSLAESGMQQVVLLQWHVQLQSRFVGMHCIRKPTQLVGDDIWVLRGLRHLSIHPMLVDLLLE